MSRELERMRKQSMAKVEATQNIISFASQMIAAKLTICEKKGKQLFSTSLTPKQSFLINWSFLIQMLHGYTKHCFPMA